jgi:hypothetical protein
MDWNRAHHLFPVADEASKTLAIIIIVLILILLIIRSVKEAKGNNT